MNCEAVEKEIIRWLNEYRMRAGAFGWVVGVSGGVDSGLVSTLAAKTGNPVILVSLPINQALDQLSRADAHIDFLKSRYDNVSGTTVDLSESFRVVTNAMSEGERTELSDVNTAARLRMTVLYSIAQAKACLVVGTGNKVEDHGIGFFTKYGDGGVDLSPIADLTKTEVRELSNYLGISKDIVTATPTDGLWEDNRSDEEQIGATYRELEWAMREHSLQHEDDSGIIWDTFNERESEVMKIYLARHNSSRHKMAIPPVCILKGIK